MSIPICIFEDEYYDQLYPLSETKPVFELRCGILTLREKIQRQFSSKSLILTCRDYLKDFLQSNNPNAIVNQINGEKCLFINGRLLVDEKIYNMIDLTEETVFVHKGQTIAAFLRGKNLSEFADSLLDNLAPTIHGEVKKVEIKEAKLINYTWDLVHHNPSEIEVDYSYLIDHGEIRGAISEHAVLLNEEKIYIGIDSIVKPGAVLDAEGGPIFIGDGVTIMPQAVIEGPAFVGNKSTIKIGAKIYEGTSIGEACKVGGEVEESIIHSYSNKQHDGFLGHAYLGEWVNIGADTNNSDLKNNYGNVKVMVNGKMIDSGSMFVGLTMGDHSKTGINTMFNTGSVVGTMCNVYGAGFPPKYIPSFSWGGAEGIVEHNIEKALQTARQVMTRRKKEFSPAYEKIFRFVFEQTGKERI